MLAKRIEKSYRRRIDVMMNIAPELEKLYKEHKNNRTPRIIRQKPSKVMPCASARTSMCRATRVIIYKSNVYIYTLTNIQNVYLTVIAQIGYFRFSATVPGSCDNSKCQTQ